MEKVNIAKKLRRAEVIIFLALYFTALPSSSGQKSSIETLRQTQNHRKQRVVVFFDGPINSTLADKYNGEFIRESKGLKAGIFLIPESVSLQAVKNEPRVLRVEVEEKTIKRIPVNREDTYSAWKRIPMQPLEQNDGVVLEWNLQKEGMNAQPVWASPYNCTGDGIIIAFLDSGVNYNLEDLNAPKYLGGYDFIHNDDDPWDDDITIIEGHGTAVTTIAVAEGVEKIIGAAPQAKYYALKILNQCGDGFPSDVIDAIQWVIEHNAVALEDDKIYIINMSIGGYNMGVWQQEFGEKCEEAYDAGIILIAGVGNDKKSTPMYPAAYEHVIAVGGHDEYGQLYDHPSYGGTNGGGDVLAPGARVPSMDRNGDETYHYWGTSFAAPHAAGLMALQIECAKKRHIDINNGYNWEVMLHSAVDLGLDPAWQGKGKIWAAQTDSNDANLGSLDLIASNWPLAYDMEFSDYAFADVNYPAYHIGSDVNQTITLTNITDILGNTTETIENLTVTVKQLYYDHPNQPNLPGDSIEVLPTISGLYPNDGNSVILSLLYTIPPDTAPGLVQTKLELEFNFIGNNRTIKVGYHQPNLLWYAAIPGDLNLDNKVDMTDFAIFSRRWRNLGCIAPDYCNRADINNNGQVDWSDISVLAENWLRN